MDGLPAQVTRWYDVGRGRRWLHRDSWTWVGLDAGQQEHFADVLDDDGERLGARPAGLTMRTA